MLLRSLVRASTARCHGALRAASQRAASTASTVVAGDTLPPGIELHAGFPPAKFDLADRLAKKNALLVGLPGAFTPT